MQNDTIGRRIAEERKKLTLSQEALGEKLGVSRQAISKWESDAAIPEIDKLIALSRLFGVSVGYLLGVEENPAAPAENPDLSDAQLKMVEEIVSRYQPKPKKPLLSVAAFAVAAVSLLLALSMGMKLRSQPDYSTQLSNLQWNYNQISGQLNSVSSALEQLQNAANVLDSYQILLEPAEDLSGVTVKFSGTPKVLQPGDTAVFSVRRENDEAARVCCGWNGSAYTAEVFLQKANGYLCSFALTHADGTTELFSIPENTAGANTLYYDLSYALSYTCNSDMLFSFSGRLPTKLSITELQVYINPPYLQETGDARCSLITLTAEHNGNPYHTFWVYAPGSTAIPAFDTMDTEPEEFGSFGKIFSANPAYTLPLEPWNPGDTVRFRVEVIYNNGKTIQFYIPNALVCTALNEVEIDYFDTDYLEIS